MALEGTHIRFAAELKDKYKISDIDKYISGTVYPDSRYVTGADRNLTHPKEFKDDPFFYCDDFKKGWLVHLLCDRTQAEAIKELFPEYYSEIKKAGDKSWINRTAIKILQDMDDVKKFDIKKFLPCLDYVENPGGEDIEIIKKYNRIFQEMYAEPEKVGAESCYKMWRQLGLPKELADRAKLKAEELQRDHRTMDLVKEIYPRMIIKAKLEIEKYRLAQKKRFIIFDFDGVIVDSFKSGFEAYKIIFPDLGEDDFRRLLEGNVYEKLKGTNFDSSLFFKIYIPKLLDAPAIGGIAEALAELSREYGLFIISSTVSAPIREWLAKNNLDRHFIEVMGSDVHQSKVEKLKIIFEKYGIGSDDCVFITDTLGDLREAKKVGISSLAVTYGFHDEKTLLAGNPKCLIERPQDILSKVEKYWSDKSY